MATTRFLEQSFPAVLKEIEKKCISTGLEACDLAVKVDFMPNEDGNMPAFQDPPIFEVVLIQDLDSLPDLPALAKRKIERTGLWAVLVLRHSGNSYANLTILDDYHQATN